MQYTDLEEKSSKALVVYPNIYGNKSKLSSTARLEEAEGLSAAIGLEVILSEVVNVKTIKPAAFFSKGILDRFSAFIEENEIDLLIVDTTLSPVQQRNLERELDIKVIDRTALILEIFGERAKTREGVLQVELAHLTYQRSRLVRSWTHLERQRGGAGFLGGPGETQIELDRRIIDDKIVKIKKELDKVKRTRSLQRVARKKIPYPIVALVGYTNAGKSSIFNKLSNSNVFAQDLLFATLDPTMRKVQLPSGTEIILSDTVGFISDLPHELVMSFRSTLEEVLEADIIVHVRDIHNDNSSSQKNDVLLVLDNLGLKDIESSSGYIEVYNKADLLEEEDFSYYSGLTAKSDNMVLTSAETGEGLESLLNMIDTKLSAEFSIKTIHIPVSNGQVLSWIYENAHVLERKVIDDETVLKIKISQDNLSRLQRLLLST